MSNKLNADELLREAFEVLAPFQGGSSGEADRKTALRGKIARYLGEHGKPLAGGGGGGPATFHASLNACSLTFVPGIGFVGGGGAGKDSGPTAAIGGNGLGGSGGGGLGMSMADMRKQQHEKAMKLGKPVLTGAGGGGGNGYSFSEWMFPDGHTEILPINTEPEWPKD